MEPEAPDEDMRCIELVELLTPYIDGELDDEIRGRVDRHLRGCDGCTAALDEFKTIIRIAGRLTPADVAGVDPLIRDHLLATLKIPRRR